MPALRPPQSALTAAGSLASLPVIEWDSEAVTIYCRADEDRVVQVACCPLTSGDSGQTPEDVAGLREFLTTHLPDATSAVVTLSGRLVSHRLLLLPNSEPAELYSLIDLQVETRLEEESEGSVWAVHIHNSLTRTPVRPVSLLMTSGERTRRIQDLLQSCGIHPERITCAAPSLHEAVRAADQDRCLHIRRDSESLSLHYFLRGIPAGTLYRPADLPPNELATFLNSAVMRLHAAAQPELREEVDAETTQILLHGFSPGEADTLERLTPDSMNPVESGFSDPVAAASLSNVTSATDFLNPRCKDPRIAAKRRRLVLGAITAAVLLLLPFAWKTWSAAAERERVARLQQEHQQLQDYVSRGASAIARGEFLQTWLKAAADPAAELSSLVEQFPAKEKMLLTRVQLENSLETGESALRIDGLAETTDLVMSLNEALLEQRERYEVRPGLVQPAAEGSPLASRFRLEADLRPEGQSGPEAQG